MRTKGQKTGFMDLHLLLTKLACDPPTELMMVCVFVSAFNNLTQRFTMFNGGFSKDQLDWLDSLLSSADEKQEKVTIVSK